MQKIETKQADIHEHEEAVGAGTETAVVATVSPDQDCGEGTASEHTTINASAGIIIRQGICTLRANRAAANAATKTMVTSGESTPARSTA